MKALRWFRARLDDESGFSLVELLVVMVMMVIVTGVAFNGLNNVTKNSWSTEQRSAAQSEVRGALELIIRDLRAAQPINVRTTVDEYATAVDFFVYCSPAGVGTCDADGNRHIEYEVVANQLERTAEGVTTMRLGPSGPDGLASHLQRSAVVNDPVTEPVFTYYDKNGVALETSGPSAPSETTFRNCARSVRIHLVVRGEPNNVASELELETTVALRNEHEVPPCTP